MKEGNAYGEEGDENICAYFLEKKNRRCRMLTKSGNKYCGEHATFSNAETRVACPYDGHHTVALSRFEKHLKVCNSRLKTDNPLVSENVNAINSEVKFDEKIDRRVDMDKIVGLVSRVKDVYSKLQSYRGERETVVSNEVLNRFLYSEGQRGLMSDKRKKHLTQYASIIGQLKSLDMLLDDEEHCLLELGAGRGELAFFMASHSPKLKFVLVDRSGVRNKKDNEALRIMPSLKLERVRIAIEHLEIAKMVTIQNAKSVTVVTKHLCGSATDAAIRCVLNAIDQGVKINNILLTPCCHHKCRLVEYVNGEFLEDTQFGNEDSFACLRHISSWATCGIRLDGADRESAEKRQLAGEMAKYIVETGRAKELEKRGFSVKIIEYVNKTITPERLMIVAKKRISEN